MLFFLSFAKAQDDRGVSNSVLPSIMRSDENIGRTLSGRLIPADNKLGKRRDAFESAFVKLSDNIEHATLLIALKAFER